METELIRRLRHFRGQVRRRLVAYGCCAVVAGGVVAYGAIVLADWLLWLPPLPRCVTGVLFLLGFVLATLRWIVRPLRASLDVDELAGKLEQHFGHFEDRLTTTVNFLRRPPGGSPDMVAKVISNTDRLLSGIPFDTTLTIKPVLRAASAMLLASSMLVTLAVAMPTGARIGLYRYLYPFGAFEWPRRVALEPLTGDDVVPVGESYTVSMRVTRGLHDDLRGVVRIREADGAASSLTMEPASDGVYHATIDQIGGEIVYWFEAGDASTAGKPFTLTAVRRPAALEAIATVSAPPYAPDRPAREFDILSGSLQAARSARATITVRSSKPLHVPSSPDQSPGQETMSHDSAGMDAGAKFAALKAGPDREESSGLLFADGRFIPATVSSHDGKHYATASFVVNDDTPFEIVLYDVAGLRSFMADRVPIELHPDQPPWLRITEPIATVELTPTGTLAVSVQAEDDWGLSRLWLEVRTLLAETADVVVLSDYTVDADHEHRIRVTATAELRMADRNIAAGDVVIYQAKARDNFVPTAQADAEDVAAETAPAANGETGQLGASATLRIRIISEVEFDIRLRDDLALLEKHLRDISVRQANALDATQSLVRDAAAADQALSAAEAQAARQNAEQQLGLSRDVDQVARRFRRLADRIQRNTSGQDDLLEQTSRAAGQLERVARQEMRSAAGRANAAASATTAKQQQADLRDATADQREASRTLQNILRAMSRWGDYSGLMARTRDLLDRQKQIRRDTDAVGKTSLGKRREDLSNEESAALGRARRRQDRMAEDVEQLLDQMQRMAQQLQASDQAAAMSVEQAVRSARADEVVRKLREAARALDQNRTAAAQISQAQAEDAIRRMMKSLRDREKRELALLRKQVEEAEQQLANLIKDEEALAAATQEAAGVDAGQAAFVQLAQEQRRLRNNARLLGQELESKPETVSAAPAVDRAANEMQTAEDALEQQAPAVAQPPQQNALAALREALAELQRIAERAALEEQRRNLADIAEQLEKLLALQVAINADIQPLRDDVQRKGMITRPEARRASRLARRQSEALDFVRDIQPELAKVVVYEWALQRVSGWMETSRDWLASRKIDDELTETALRIETQLRSLLEAIRKTQDLPLDEQFAESDQGGGGGGGAGGQQKPQKPIPTVAELLVLLQMQADINSRTRELGESVDEAAATETQLRQLHRIGEDQAEVRRLTEMVTKRAQAKNQR